MDKKRILVVDDHAPNRELITLVLQRSGYETAEAASGITAIEQARTACPDLILLDLGLPGMNGDEVLAHLKEDPITSDIPVIINTAYHAQSPLVQRALALGVAEIIYKPMNFGSLREAVRQHLPYSNSGSEEARSLAL
jgi:two-component system response regulator (stage 0 sporulation protein F)